MSVGTVVRSTQDTGEVRKPEPATGTLGERTVSQRNRSGSLHPFAGIESFVSENDREATEGTYRYVTPRSVSPHPFEKE